MTERAWQRLLKDATPKWADHDAPAYQVNLADALKELTRRERLVLELWYSTIVLSGATQSGVDQLTCKILASQPPDQGTPIDIDVQQVHGYRMKALAKLKRPDVQRILRRQPDSVAA